MRVRLEQRRWRGNSVFSIDFIYLSSGWIWSGPMPSVRLDLLVRSICLFVGSLISLPFDSSFLNTWSFTFFSHLPTDHGASAQTRWFDSFYVSHHSISHTRVWCLRCLDTTARCEDDHHARYRSRLASIYVLYIAFDNITDVKGHYKHVWWTMRVRLYVSITYYLSRFHFIDRLI